jgi:hypothetical protein
MGDIADMMIEGLLDEETGELIDGTAPGYPRSAAYGNLPWSKRKKKKPAKSVAAGLAAVGKVQCQQCGKRVKAAGLQDHINAVHPMSSKAIVDEARGPQ